MNRVASTRTSKVSGKRQSRHSREAVIISSDDEGEGPADQDIEVIKKGKL